jgi:tRNA nucleotidyltransferase (CCA-adding enzyme)
LRELIPARDTPAGPAPYHSQSLLNHIIDIMNKMKGHPHAVWMGLCHDLGKLATEPSDWPRHYGHDIAGERLARRWGRRLKLSNRLIQAGTMAARSHMVLAKYNELRPGTKVKLLMRLHRCHLIAEMIALVRADKNIDLAPTVHADLNRILAVKLDGKHRNRGKKSGQILHQMRIQALF